LLLSIARRAREPGGPIMPNVLTGGENENPFARRTQPKE